MQDSISLGPKLKLDLGLRYDFIGAPTEPNNNLVVFDAANNSLVQLGSGIDQIHKNGSDFQPRLGVIWNPTGDGSLAVRGAYAVMDQPDQHRAWSPAATSNPPLATPLNVAGAVRLDSALATAQASGLAPTTTEPGLQPGRMQTWNVNVEREFGAIGLMVGYFGSHGDRLRIPVNINQFVNGVRPFPTLSATSPISARCGARQHHRGPERRLVATTRGCGSRRTAGCRAGCSCARRTRCRSRPTRTRTTAPARTPTVRCRTASTSPTAKGRRTSTSRHRFSLNATYELPFQRQPAEGRLAGGRRRCSCSPAAR